MNNDKIITVQVDEDLSIRLESCSYEVESRKSIIAECIRSGMDMENPTFKGYHQAYLEFYALMEHTKRELEAKYIQPIFDDITGVNWKLRYDTRELVITPNGQTAKN